MQSVGRSTTTLNVKHRCKTVMFFRNKAFSQWRLLKQCKILFLSRSSNFNDDEEFCVVSDLFEWKNPCFPYEDY